MITSLRITMPQLRLWFASTIYTFSNAGTAGFRLKTFLFAFSFLFCMGAIAQRNIAYDATPTHSGGGSSSAGFGPENYNDSIIPAGTAQPWGWVSGNGWIEYTWTNPVGFQDIILYHGSRKVTGGTIEAWNAATLSYDIVVSDLSLLLSPGNEDTLVLPNRVNTTKLRFNNLSGSNPTFREIEVYEAPSGFNDAGVSSISALTGVCQGSLPVEATIRNFGINQITSLTVNWEVDGVIQTPITYNSLLDTINGSGINSATVILGNFTFSANQNYAINAWTSAPNGGADTTTYNDTASSTLRLNPPGGLGVNNITAQTADVIWTATGGTSFNVIYGLSGFDPATGGQTVTSINSPASLSSLLPGTAYEAYLIANCGSGNFSDTAGPVAFSTLCQSLSTPLSLPFTEDFESYAGPGTILSDSIFICNTSYSWSYGKAGTTGELLLSTTTTGSANSGVQSAILAGGSGATGERNDLILSMNLSNYDTTGPAKVLEFYFKDFADEADPEDRVHIRGDVSDQWVEIFDWSTVNSSDWERVKINLTAALKDSAQTFSDSTQIRWSQNDNATLSGGDGFGVDDINIEEVTCFDINNVVFNNITYQSAQVVLQGEDTGTNFDIVWGPCGFNQASPSVISGSGTDSLVMNNLLPSTCYEAYIIKNCGGTDGYSDTTGPFTFTTGCLLTAPISEDFESGFSAGATGANISPCLFSVRTSDPNWEVENATGANENTASTGPHYDNTNFGTSGGYYLYLETTSGAQGDADTLTTVLIDVRNLTNPYLSFAYHMYGADIGSLSVEVFDNGSWSNLTTISGQQQSAGNSLWKFYRDTISGLVDDTIQLRFIGVRGAGDKGDISIDDLQLTEAPVCIESRLLSVIKDSITGTSAMVTFVPGTGTKYQLEYGPVGYSPGSTSALGTVTVTDTFHTITGLSASMEYDVYVRDSCAGGYSNFTGPLTFKTDCAPTTPIVLPFTDGFETYSGPISSDGNFYCGTNYIWSVERPGGTGDILFTYTGTSGPTPPNGGSQSAGFQSLSSSNPIYLILTVDMSAYTGTGLGIELSFFYADHADEPSAGDRVWARGSKTDPWIEVFDWSTVNSNNWEQAVISLRGALIAAGQNFSNTTQIRWGQQDNAALNGADGFSIDDVSITEIACPDPSGLTATHLSDTSANMTFVGNINAINYEIWFGPENFYQGTQSTTGGFRTFTTYDSLNVDTLSSNTCYEFLVRAVCGAGDTTAWVGPFVYCTECANKLNGTYTIGTSGTYPDFSTAALALNDCGVDGPVIFNVEEGTYNEQVELEDITGVSAINTITFRPDPANTNPVVVTFGATASATNYVWSFNNTSYVTIEALTLTATGASFAKVIDMSGTGSHIIIKDNILSGKAAANSSSHNFDIISNNTAVGNLYDDCLIKGNVLNGGSFGIYLYGVDANGKESNNIVDSNDVIDFSWSGISMNYQDNAMVRGNYINSTNTNATTYGIYSLGNSGTEFTGNEVYAKGTTTSYGLYSDADNGSAADPNIIVNNMIGALDNSGTAYGLYIYNSNYTYAYHNSVLVNAGSAAAGRALYLNTSASSGFGNVEVINNNLVNTGGGVAVEISSNASSGYITQMDYNNLYATGTDLGRFGSTAAADLAAWRTASSLDANSVSGDPVYMTTENLHALGSINNNAGTPLSGVTTDIDGESRSATAPDIGADEYTPVAGDLSVDGAVFYKGLCLSTNDSIGIYVQNLIGSPVDFSNDPLTVNYQVSGPVTTTGSVVVNTGTLGLTDSIEVVISGIDLSVPGIYTLNADIMTNGINVLSFNDTLDPAVDLEVEPEFMVTPSTVTLTSATDSAEICVQSSFFSGGAAFFISEISHYYNGGSNPGVKPPYLTSDDYIEVTGVPGADLEGITLEIYRGTTTTPLKSYTFPAGTVMGPNGTAIIMTGQTGKASEPANFLYDGRGGNTTTMGSGDDAGYILRDGTTIVDAVTYDAFTFPSSTGVTSADWTGQVTGTSGTAGIRLISDDNNSAADWAVVTTSAPQDANVLNSGVTLPAPAANAGFTWTLNGVVTDTSTCTYAGPHTTPGSYNYIANYTNACGTFTDTVVVIVPTCLPPSNLSAGAITGNSATLRWDTVAGNANNNFQVSYGTGIQSPTDAGAILAMATADSLEITGLTGVSNYCFYVREICSPGDTSIWVGPYCFNTLCIAITAPYSENFDAVSIPAIPQCWASIATSSTTIQTVTSTDHAAAIPSLPNALEMNDASPDLVVSPEFSDLSTGLNRVRVMIAYEGGGTTYNDTLFFGTMADQVNQASFVPYDTLLLGSTNGSFMQYTFDLNNLALIGNNSHVAFKYAIAGGGYEFYFDDFVYEAIPGGPGCPAPTNLASSNEGCDSVEVSWNSNSGNTNNSSIIEFGPTGFTPGAGTFISFVNSSEVITGLTPGTTYDVYVADTCGGDTTSYTGPVSFTTLSGPLPVASFTPTVNGFNVSFDASASTNANSYGWDFGDNNTGTGINPTHLYGTGGSFTVVLTAENACGTDDTTIILTDVSLMENAIQRSLEVYPNPTNDAVTIAFETGDSKNISVRITDVSGKEIMKISADSANGRFEQQISLGNLSDGVYIIKIEAGQLRAHQRLIKQ